MFSLLSEYFANTGGLLHILSYVTARCGAGMVFSFLFVILLMPKYIHFSCKWQKKGQPIRENYLPEHAKKKGTPTLGGVMIITSVLLSCALFADLMNGYVQILLFVLISFGLIGFVDDYKKVQQMNIGGLRGKLKMVFQILFGIATVLFANYYVDNHIYSSVLTFPYLKKLVLDLGIVYTIFRVFVIVGSSNAVNLTDGLDGLVSFPLIVANIVFIIFAYIIGNAIYSRYLLFNYQNGAQEICILLSSVVGAVAGFLWYNAKPAQIFMGDTGSLALGGLLGTTAVLIKCEILLAIVGGLFVIETLSVILQVLTFRISGGKKRAFKMAPIHHHFEKCNWSEMQVIVRFWIISMAFAVIGLASLKVR